MFVLPYPTRARHLIDPAFGRTLERLFDAPFVPSTDDDGAARSPALDVSETDSAYLLSFDLPGVGRDQIKVAIEGRRVALETAAITVVDGKPADGNAARALYRERGAARYARTVSLPGEVDPAQSSAKFDNGVLLLTLAKRVPTGGTQLSIG